MEDEYIITNQLGGYSSSTFKNGNTRKYHGLLVVSDEKLDRKVILNTIQEEITHNKVKNHLNVFHFLPDVTIKDSSIDIENTKIEKSKIIIEYRFNWGKLTKEIVLMQEENALELKYMFSSTETLKFELSPFITNRSIHQVGNGLGKEKIEGARYLNKYQIPLSPFEKLEMFIMSFNAKNMIDIENVVKEDQIIYKNFYYPVEKDRGFESSEDLVRILTMIFEINPGESYINIKFRYLNENFNTIMQSFDTLKVNPLTYFYKTKSNNNLNTLANLKNFLVKRSEDFLIDFGRTKTIIAGYHWFGDWGRDTFISLRGLLLTTKEYKFASEVITYWARLIDKRGFIANDLRSSSYNSIDSSLWFIVAIYYYYIHTKDLEFIKLIFPKIDFVMQNYIDGDEKLSIKITKEKFLSWDDEKMSLTWMDSIVNSKSATNRIGSAVEIQFLWYNCYKIYSLFEKLLQIKESRKDLKKIFLNFKKDFTKKFVNKEKQYLYDCVNKEKNQDFIRPNAIIGLSLPFSLLSLKDEKMVLMTAQEKLLTEFGLYSLDPSDSNFVSDISGNIDNRDRAYHNGAIWPYLLGMYLKAYLRVNKNSKESKDYVFKKLLVFWEKFNDKNLNYIPEIFTPTNMSPDGCLTQAWNYATLLEVLYEFENSK